ncbi:glial cell line-derived neurotrophic factor-like isoform X2 [Xenopus laevis]|nr:glial cell line-derived neurotrophic factor-like isoform X2 [Xenopus laevis]XP_018116308.1 glial cell line-derived neurotrophic factor-like isoform X2 [Xenopus laevis]
MLSFGQGGLTVTLCYWWKNQIKICRGQYRSAIDCGQVCCKEKLNASTEQCPEWSSRPEESTGLVGELPEKLSEPWCPKQRNRKSLEHNSKDKGRNHDRKKLFMGRGSLSMTISLWSYKKVTLWTIIVLFLLLPAMVTGSPTPEVNMNGQPKPEQEAGIMGTVRPDSLEPTPVEVVDQIIRSTWSSYYADNVTSQGHLHDDLQDDLLLRSERSPIESTRSKKNKKKSDGRRKGGGGKACSLRRVRLKVRDLGLGHDSEESVLFSYCSGVCQHPRSNYDIALSTLLKEKLITPGSHERVRDQPCCRPTRYERISFMDVNNNWKTVEMLLAAECSCV